jgi:hypothetical protein
MLATTKIVRKFARAINGGGFGYAGTYTDKAVKDTEVEDNGIRLLAFRLHDKAAADKLAQGLREALFLAGFENYKVKRTSSEGDSMRRNWGGEYVRVKALLG